MLRLKSMMLLALLALSASGCSAQLPERLALTTPETTPAARKAALVAKFAPRCPTPTRWTRAQQIVVGSYMVDEAEKPGMQLLAPEWERLNDGAKACRGVK
jgi:hypothetical protein